MYENIIWTEKPSFCCWTTVTQEIRTGASNRADVAVCINFAYPMIKRIGNEQIPLTIDRQAIRFIQG